MDKIRVAIAGLGGRGLDAYGMLMQKMPEYEVVAIAEPRKERQQKAQETFQLPDCACFDTAEAMIEAAPVADVVAICTQDRQHYHHAMTALRKGYHLLLEKPISPVISEFLEIEQLAKALNRRVVVCHVLRYSPIFKRLKQLINDGAIGEIMTIQAMECVEYAHQAHSFVRGNWRRADISSPMILQKCCHDMDIFCWLIGSKPKSVASHGTLAHFKKENAPEGAAMRCLDNCPVQAQCPYDCEKLYITSPSSGVRSGNVRWPNNVVAIDPTEEKLRKALREGPYGRCVYHCDNDVPDHQTLSAVFENGVSLSFTMTAFTSKGGRSIKIMGTKGDIIANTTDPAIVVTAFGKPSTFIGPSDIQTDGGHSGGDIGMLIDFAKYIQSNADPSHAITAIDKSIDSHLLACAAEKSRLAGGALIEISTLC